MILSFPPAYKICFNSKLLIIHYKLKNLFRLVLILIVFCAGCKQKELTSESAFLKWMHSEENGLCKSKKVNGFVLTAKYLPAEYLTYNELKGKPYTQNEIDSLLNHYNKARTFLFTIAPENSNKAEGDVMFNNVYNGQEYKQRVHQMNFQLEDLFRLKAEEKSFAPVMSAMENIYSLGNQRSLYMVFADNEEVKGVLEQQELDLTFSDDIFNTGINHFTFNKEDFDNVPKIGFWKTEKSF